jgi:hypothetical protein
MTTRLLAFAFLAALSQSSGAQVVEFEGVPTVKIEVHEGKVTTQVLSTSRQSALRVRIVRDGDRYLWVTRNNLPMVKQESGSYVTYTAASGAGYVRVLGPALRAAIQQLSAEQRAREFTYTEHMLHQLGSLTYFGK